MTDIYVRSTTGSDSNGGTGWADAVATLAKADALSVAGDRILVSQVHSETITTTTTLSWPGTVDNPVQILCVNDTTGALTTGAVIKASGSLNLTHTGHCYQYGLTYKMGDPTGNASLLMACGNNDVEVFERCTFECVASGARLRPSGSGLNLPKIVWKDCDVKFGVTNQYIDLTQVNFTWDGGSFLTGVTPSTLFTAAAGTRGAIALISGLDLSAASSSLTLFGSSGYVATIRNSRMPAAWGGDLYSGTMLAGGRIAMHNCDSTDTNYRITEKEYTAELIQETTIVRTGGASDGVTPLSWKVVSTANCNFLSGRFQSPEIFQWNDTVGSLITATVEIVHDSLTALKDDEIWLEIQYLGTSGYPLGTFKSDAKVDVLASAVAQDSSSATWTTTGLTNPNKQKLSVSFTPQEKGYIHARVCMGRAGYTVYVDPKLTVS